MSSDATYPYGLINFWEKDKNVFKLCLQSSSSKEKDTIANSHFFCVYFLSASSLQDCSRESYSNKVKCVFWTLTKSLMIIITLCCLTSDTSTRKNCWCEEAALKHLIVKKNKKIKAKADLKQHRSRTSAHQEAERSTRLYPKEQYSSNNKNCLKGNKGSRTQYICTAEKENKNVQQEKHELKNPGRTSLIKHTGKRQFWWLS